MAQDLSPLQKMKNRIKEDQYYYKELARERAEKERQIREANLARQAEAERANRASLWESNPVAAMFSSEPKVHLWTPEDYERMVASAEAAQKSAQERKPAQASPMTAEQQAYHDKFIGELAEATESMTPAQKKRYFKNYSNAKETMAEVEAYRERKAASATHTNTTTSTQSTRSRLDMLNAGGQRFVAVGEEGSKHIIPVDYLRRR